MILFDSISKTLRTKRAWFVLQMEEAMLMSVTHTVTDCYGQGSLFFSGIDVCSLMTQNETLTSSVTTPTPKRNSPDKK